jgi:hypothetical protein
LRRGLLYFALTGWRNALSTGYAWILAIRFGIGESATFRSQTRIAAPNAPRCRYPDKLKAKRANGLRPEYRFDYTKAKPNRFAGHARPGSVAVLLDPDVARVFQSAKSVNAVLRALVATMPSRRTPTERAL